MTRLGFWTGRSALLFLVAVLSFSSVFAQPSDSTKPVRSNSLKPGAWALQFQITQDFTLRDFQGLLISAKRHYSKRKAIRFGVGLSASVFESNVLSTSFQNDTLINRIGGNQENNGQSFDFIGQYVVYANSDSRALFYFGGGPVGGFSRSKYNSTSTSGNRNTQTTVSWNAGFSSAFGAEWFATRNISLLAEYGLALKYNWSKSTYKSSSGINLNQSESRQESLTINSATVKLGLAVYF